MVNFILAIVWLGFGGWLLFLHYVQGDERLQLGFFVINTLLIGWMAVALAAYNLVRWYSQVQSERNRRVIDPDRPAHPRREEPSNPDFDFTKQPPSNPADRPPSPN